MKLIYQRENLVKAIPLMALMAAINIIVAEIAALSIIASIFLILILPLASTIVELSVKDRYFPIYGLATIGLCLALTFWNIDTTIFYVIPSVITGYIFGLFAKLKIPTVWSIISATLAQTAITYALIPFINFVFQVDIIETFQVAFGLANKTNIGIIVPTFIFMISLIQVSLSQIVVNLELQKFGIKEQNSYLSNLIIGCVGGLFALLIIPFYFVSLGVAYLFLAFSLYFMVNVIVFTIYEKRFLELIPYGLVMFLNIFLVAFLNSYLKENSQLLLICFSSALICLISIVFSFLKKKKEKIQ